MARNTLKLRTVVPLGLGFLLLDALVSLTPGWQSTAASYVFQIAAPVLAFAACCWQSTRVAARPRWLWILFAAGLFIWIIGILLSAWEDLIQHLPFETASAADFAFFFYGVPLLFALSTPQEGQQFSLFSWLNGIQSLFAGYLSYVTIFSVLPFTSQTTAPIPIALLVLTYNVENIVLAVSCLMRMLSSQKESEERLFYRTLFVFLLFYGVGVALYNHQSLVTPGHTAPDLLVNVPLILLAGLIAILPQSKPAQGQPELQKSRLALFIDLGSPVLFTSGLLTLGLVVLHEHFYIAMAAIGVALSVYGLRTTILQIRYMQAQRQLQKARDRLEEISLQDGLTGIANRRSFDLTLDTEWHRATRSEHPLSLILIDLDFFKNINDTFGHPYGDRCLIEVAGVLRSVAARSGDLVARYGGEEFAVILPATTADGAIAVAKQMQQAVLDLRIVNETSVGRYASMSIGVAEYSFVHEGSPAKLIDAADRALYEAKLNGRNRIERASMLDQLSTTPPD